MDNPFKKIIDKALSLFPNSNISSDLALGIDISSSSIKVVEIKKKGEKMLLETYGSIYLGPYAELDNGSIVNLPTEKIVEALKEVLKQAGVNSTSASLCISIKSTLIFNIYLPDKLNKNELDSIVATEARKYIPIPLEEVSLSFFEIPQKQLSFKEMNDPDFKNENKDKKEMLIVAVQNDAISKLRSINSTCNLKSDLFEVEIFSAVRSCFGSELSLTLFIDFGASSVKIAFVEFGIVKSCHVINRGSVDMTLSISRSLSIPFSKAEEYKKDFGMFDNPVDKNIPEIIKVHTDYILGEINNILSSYQKKHNVLVNKIIFTGGGSLLKGFEEELRTMFKVEVVFARPFDKIYTPQFLDKVIEKAGGEFSVAIGLALRKLQ